MPKEKALCQSFSYTSTVTLSKLHLKLSVQIISNFFKIKVNGTINQEDKRSLLRYLHLKYENGAHHLRNNVLKEPLKQEIVRGKKPKFFENGT